MFDRAAIRGVDDSVEARNSRSGSAAIRGVDDSVEARNSRSGSGARPPYAVPARLRFSAASRIFSTSSPMSTGFTR
jgi:hypothetical protein